MKTSRSFRARVALVKVAPLPRRKIIGTLSETAPVLRALGLPHEPRT